MVGPPPIDSPAGHAVRGEAVCVTGGAGFIGSHLVGALAGAGASVRVIDDLSSATSDRLTDLIEAHEGRVRFTHASILEPGAMAEASRGARWVFHLAAMSSAAEAQEDPARCVEVNGLGTARVLEASRHAGVQRVVYAASASAYGDTAGPNREDQPPAPMSPYAAGKLAGEHAIAGWARSMGVDGVSLRLFNVYGPGQSEHSPYAAVIPAFATRLRAGLPPVIYGDGSQTRDFVHVSDVVRAMTLAAARPAPWGGIAVNIGSGRSVSIAELASVMARLCGEAPTPPIHEPSRAGDIAASECDPSRAEREMGFRARVTLEDGLDALLDGCRGARREAV